MLLNAFMPAIFFGHGNPMNAITQNAYTETWGSMGHLIPRPKAVLAISAHWYITNTAVTINAHPRTIHDFGGFPKELYQVQYPAPGDPELAAQVKDFLSPVSVESDDSWGLDHGTWSVLCHVFPNADIPIVQLSIDARQPPRFHYEIGQKLAPLREQNVLIMGSGNIVHNLEAFAWGQNNADPYAWAIRFEEQARELLLKGEDAALIAYEQLGPDALLSIPTPDHYLPLLYILGTRKKGEPVRFPVEGVDGGSISMLAVQIG